MPSTSSATVTKTPKLRKSASSSSSKKSKSSDAPATTTNDDFFWTYTEEPHRTRRIAIIKSHPEITKLCGHEPLTKWVVLAVVALQVACALYLKDTAFWSLKYWGLAYVIGATANQNLFLAIHEISHNLAFKSPMANRLLAIFANLPIGIPYSASFRVCLPPREPRYNGSGTDEIIALPPDAPQIARRRRR